MEPIMVIIFVVSIAVILISLAIFRKAVFGYVGEIVERNIEKNKDSLKEERERMLEQLQAKSDVVEKNKDYIKELVSEIRKELSESKEKLERSEIERVGEFNKLKSVVEEHRIVTDRLKDLTENLKNTLSNNQLRGRYGEEVAEDLLRTVGFIKGENYIVNEAQDTNSNRPDFTIFLPNGDKINIDVKFPLGALIKFQETDKKEEQEKFKKRFARDVREKVRQVTERGYINPEEGTVDFVILFVPNERIFSFIYDQLRDVWDEAMKKKVIMTGPFSFVAILRMIFQSYKNFQYQENLREIIKLIKTFEDEYNKFSDALNILGVRLESATKQYEQVSSTRRRKLSKIIERIKSEKVLEKGEKNSQLKSGDT